MRIITWIMGHRHTAGKCAARDTCMQQAQGLLQRLQLKGAHREKEKYLLCADAHQFLYINYICVFKRICI